MIPLFFYHLLISNNVMTVPKMNAAKRPNTVELSTPFPKKYCADAIYGPFHVSDVHFLKLSLPPERSSAG
jgi:hypothetical protein